MVIAHTEQSNQVDMAHSSHTFMWLEPESRHDNTYLCTQEDGTKKHLSYLVSIRIVDPPLPSQIYRACKRGNQICRTHSPIEPRQKNKSAKVCLLSDAHWLRVIKGRVNGSHGLCDWLGERMERPGVRAGDSMTGGQSGGKLKSQIFWQDGAFGVFGFECSC